MLATAVYLSGTPHLEVGGRYGFMIDRDRLRLVGPHDPSVTAFEQPIAGVMAVDSAGKPVAHHPRPQARDVPGVPGRGRHVAGGAGPIDRRSRRHDRPTVRGGRDPRSIGGRIGAILGPEVVAVILLVILAAAILAFVLLNR